MEGKRHMTDLLTRPVEEQRQVTRRSSSLTAKLLVISSGLLLGLLVGWALFNNFGPSPEELEQAHWEQVVDYYSQQYQVMADTQARAEAAHWQEVVNHYARQYELIATAAPGTAPRNDALHWQAVADYYEKLWEVRTR
jgi:hypothetical protein